MKHTMLKCLSLVMALATILGVFAVPAAAVVNTCNHYAYEENWLYIGEKQPTCTEYGGKVYECPNCDKQFVDSRDWAKGEYLPLDHDWEETSRQDATLEADGWVKYECARCGAKKTEPLSATKCPNNTCNYTTVDTATCTEAGKITKTCSVCGHKVEEDSPAKGHTWDDGEIVVAPKCGVDANNRPYYGTIKFTCTVDGCNGERLDETVLPTSTSHKWEWVEAKDTACGVAGNTAGYKCVYCTAAHPTEPSTVLPAPAHDYQAATDATHVNVALGCQDEVIWNKCTVCGDWKDISDRTATGVDGNHYIKLNADGYTVDATATTMVNVSPVTCEAAAIYKCTAGDGCTYVVTVGTKKPHNFDASLKREPTCQQYGAYVCGDCGAVAGYKDLEGNIINPELNKKPHEADANGKTVVAPGCTKQGYTTYTCKWCLTVQKEEYTDPLGHDRVETLEQGATCIAGGHTAGWVCGRGNDCDKQTDWEPSQPTNPLGHAWQMTSNLPANCMYGIHTNEVCTRCGIENPETTPIYDDGNKDLSKHQWDPTKTLKTDPTCEKPGSLRLYCALCFAEDENEIQAVHHSFEIVENGVVTGLKNPIGRVPATCTTPGFDVYYCTNENCDISYGAGKFYTEGETHTVNNGTADVDVIFIHHGEYALDIKLQDRYDSHYAYVNYTYNPFAATPAFTTNFTGVAHDSDGKVGTPVGFVITEINGVRTGSCAQASYLEYVCDDCTYTYNKKLSDDYGLTGQHVAGAPQNQQATCNQAGYTGRIECLRCAAVLNEGTETTASHTYDKVNYAYDENKAPSCLEIGYAKKGYCTTCQAVVYEGKLSATGHNMGTQMTPAQVANCVLEGWDAHYNCANDGCDFVLDNAAIAGLTGTALTNAVKNNNNWAPSIRDLLPATGAYINGYTAALGHDMALAGTVDFACLVDGYDYFECGRAGCDHVVVENNFHFGYANHRYTDESMLALNAANELIKCADSFLCCANIVPSANGDVACGDKKQVHEALPHTNAANETIKGLDTCANWVETQDHVCQYCGEDFTFAKIHEFLGDYNTNSHEADCQNYKHDVNTCNVCGYIWIANVDEAAGYGDHRWVSVPGTKVEATYYAPGSEDFKCSLCGEEKNVPTPATEGVEFIIDAANVNKGQVILDGSLIAVTIKTNAYQVGLTSINALLSYNADLFTYVGFEANNAFGASSSDDQDGKTTYVSAANGIVNILSVTEDYAAGGLQNADISGKEQTYITLYFRVACDAHASTADKTFALTSVAAGQVVDGARTTVAASYLNTTDVEDLAGDIYMLGDINNDLIVRGIEDAEALRSLLLVEGYEAVVAGAGDLNQDGNIDLVDFALLQKVITGAMTYAELIAAIA